MYIHSEHILSNHCNNCTTFQNKRRQGIAYKTLRNTTVNFRSGQQKSQTSIRNIMALNINFLKYQCLTRNVLPVNLVSLTMTVTAEIKNTKLFLIVLNEVTFMALLTWLTLFPTSISNHRPDVEWNHLSIPKPQRLHRWNLEVDKCFHPTHYIYTGRNYLYMLRIKLKRVRKTYPSGLFYKGSRAAISLTTICFQLAFSCSRVNFLGKSMMTSSNGNIFRVTGPLCGEFTGDRWIPRSKASDAGLWCFPWSAPE